MGPEQRAVIIDINAGPCIIAFITIHNAFIAPLMFDPMKQQLQCKSIFSRPFETIHFENVNPALDQFYIHFSDLLFCNWHEIKKAGWGLKQ